ncbi:MAG: hypothetical protein ACHQD9_03765 [Chitinophagales bacterium]
MKFLRWLLVLLFGLILYVAVNQYLFCPQYSFPQSKPFSGLKFFNPYENSDSSSWKQCNFHGHVHAWGGLTNGKGTAKQCWNLYDSLGYDVHCISDYEKVNPYSEGNTNFIPAYEHGYGFKKNHHGVLGTYQVEFGDYIFPQTLSNKQHMLDCLKKNDSVVISINHPVLRNGFPPNDFHFLQGYNLLEVLRSTTYSFPQWDSALSSGHRAFIIADDDMHDSSNPSDVARNCTWVNASMVSEKNILSNLKSGNAYGMIISFHDGETMQQKIQRFKKGFPKLNSMQIVNDTVEVSVSEKAKTIHIIGQGGKEVAQIQNASSAKYFLHSSDTYVRTQIDFDDGTSIFLNPVFRYEENSVSAAPSVNRPTSAVLWTIGVLILAAYIFLALRFLTRKSSPRQSS